MSRRDYYSNDIAGAEQWERAATDHDDYTTPTRAEADQDAADAAGWDET